MADRRRLLFLTQRVPYAPNRGDRLRAWHFLRELDREFAVDVGALVHDDEEAARIHDVPAERVVTGRVPRAANLARSAFALAGKTPLTLTMLASPDLHASVDDLVRQARPDLVIAFCSSMVPFATRSLAGRIPLVVDMVDADSAKWASLGASVGPPMSWVYRREAAVLADYERTAMRAARLTYCVNEKEAAVLRGLAPSARIEVVANGVSIEHLAPTAPARESHDVVFCGVMDYAPNVDAVTWFARDIWPTVRKRCPASTFTIVGASPTRAVSELATTVDGVTVTGRVDDVRSHLWAAAVAVAPLRTARGVQNKVLEAVAAGLPCIVTETVGAGLPQEVAPACPQAATAADFAAAVADLLEQPAAARRAMAARADLAPLGWNRRGEELRTLLREVLEAR